MTYKEDAIVVLYEADEPLTSREVGRRMANIPTDTSTVLKRLHDEDFADREGEGKRGDPYRHTLTGKGEAAAKDLTDDGDNGDAGLAALGFGDEPDEDTEVEPDVADHLIDAKVDGVEDRVSSLEDVVGQANVEREDVKHRLRELEAAVDGADHVVAFDDKEFVETILMVAQSEYGGVTKKRHVLSTLLGVEDAEEKSLLSRALSAAANKTNDDATEDDTDDVTEE